MLTMLHIGFQQVLSHLMLCLFFLDTFHALNMEIDIFFLGSVKLNVIILFMHEQLSASVYLFLRFSKKNI